MTMSQIEKQTNTSPVPSPSSPPVSTPVTQQSTSIPIATVTSTDGHIHSGDSDTTISNEKKSPRPLNGNNDQYGYDTPSDGDDSMPSTSSLASISRSGYTKVPRPSAVKKLVDSSSSAPSIITPAGDPSSIPLTSANSSSTSVATSTSAQSLQPPPASWFRIYLLCIANFGINCAWALEFALTTPYFEKTLKAGKVISHAVWLVGPLSGLIVAPIVGTLSDRCRSRFGRRRPFIFIGMIATLIGMALFSNATVIASFVSSKNSSVSHVLAIMIAIIAFCILDLAINTTMWPVRALQGDLIPSNQQHSIQSASIVMFSLGDLTASALLGMFPEPVSQIQVCFFIAALIYSITVASLLIIGRETPLRVALEDGEEGEIQSNGSDDVDNIHEEDGGRESAINIFSYLKSLPGWMWRIGITHALGFFSLFCFLPNTSSWLGSSVLGGDPYAKPGSEQALLYERGVSVYGEASLPRTAIQIVYSAVYPYLLYYITPAQLMGASFTIFGAILVTFSGTHAEGLGKLVVISMGLPIAAHFTLPVGLTVENSDLGNRGRYLGALNCFAVVPQLIDTAYTGFVSQRFGEAAVMRIGGVWALLAGCFAFLYMRV